MRKIVLLELVCFCLLPLLGLGLVGNIVPQAEPSFTGYNWVEEITTLPSGAEIDFVDVDSQGRIYVADDAGSVWKSVDGGMTWIRIDPSWTWVCMIYVDSRDYLYVQTSGGAVYCTVNQGLSWKFVFNPETYLWKWDEDSKGRIYASNYENVAPTKSLVFRSNTEGKSFRIWANFTGETWHLHSVDVAPNDWVYVLTGDTHRGATYGSIRRWNTTAWEVIVQSSVINETQRYTQPTTAWFMDDKVYFGADEWDYIICMPITGSWSQREDVLYLPSVAGYPMVFDSITVEGIGFFGDLCANLFATWDGERYVKLFKSTGQEIRHFSKQKKFPLYFTTHTNGKVYQINYMTTEDLVHIFYQLYNNKRGLRIDQDNYVLEQRITNGTNYLDLTTVALSNVEASIKGLSRRHNLLINTGFEAGNTSGWIITFGSEYLSVVTEDRYEGTCSLKGNVTTSSAGLHQDITVYPNEYLLISFAFKSNAVKNNAFEVCLLNQTAGGTVVYDALFNSATYWVIKKVATGTTSSTSWTARVRFIFKAVTLVTWFDAVVVRAPEAGYIRKSDTDYTISFGQGFNSTYSLSGTTDTLNPSLTIAGQKVSHSGTLTNGTESTPQNLTGILTGAVKVDANIRGSGQAILRIDGKRVISTVNLDTLLKSKFGEYLAWLTRYYDLNGTVVDIRDYSQYAQGKSVISLSVPIYLLALANMYEQTSEQFYLTLLRNYVDAVMSNSMNYVTVDGIGEIFFGTHYWIGYQSDTNLHQTAIMGIVATKLYLWTGNTSYKTLAQRIASESYDKLAVVKNSTDVAWSWAYYQSRDEASAKQGVNRQGMMAWFYALFGKNINSTFTPLVPKIVNWIWRAQIDDGGLGYGIGDSYVNSWYTAMSIYEVLNAYLVDSSQFSSSLKTKIANALVYISDRSPAPYDYQRLYFLASAFLSAWKTDYFVGNISIPRTKAMLYSALNSFHLTDIGFVSRLSHLSFGFRWSQYAIVPLFMAYPLPDPNFQTSDMNPITSCYYATGKHHFVGYTGGILTSYVANGRDSYGVRLYSGSGRTFFMHNTTGSALHPLPISTVTNNTYYISTTASYGSPLNYVVKLYSYPVGVHVGEVSGSGSDGVTLRLDDSANWTVAVENGTAYQINSFINPQNVTLDTKIMVWLNTTSLTSRRTFFIKAPISEWRYDKATYLFLRFNQLQTNFRVVFIELGSWGDIITDQTTAFSTLSTIADTFDTTQPLSYDIMFNTYHDKITTLQAEASWKTLYESAQSSTVKLVGHNLPQKVYLTAWAYDSEKLTFTVSASSGTSSTTKVYCGNKGEPIAIITNGTLTWTYDAPTMTLTLNVTHQSPTRIIVYWKLPGDIDGDGDVDASDLFDLSKAYGSKLGDANWNPDCDFNWDGKVDASDLFDLNKNYGRSI